LFCWSLYFREQWLELQANHQNGSQQPEKKESLLNEELNNQKYTIEAGSLE
jgi:hypothetical protein